MQIVDLLFKRLSKIGRVNEAPVEAQIKSSVSKPSHAGGAPYGPDINPVSEVEVEGLDWFLMAYLCIRLEIPLCLRMASWMELQVHLCAVSYGVAIVKG